MGELRLSQRRADLGQGLHSHILPESPQGTCGIGWQAAEDLVWKGGRTWEPIKFRKIPPCSLSCPDWAPHSLYYLSVPLGYGILKENAPQSPISLPSKRDNPSIPQSRPPPSFHLLIDVGVVLGCVLPQLEEVITDRVSKIQVWPGVCPKKHTIKE